MHIEIMKDSRYFSMFFFRNIKAITEARFSIFVSSYILAGIYSIVAVNENHEYRVTIDQMKTILFHPRYRFHSN